MYLLNRLVLTISQKWWALLLVFILNMTAFTVLFSLEDQFETISNVPVFDTQNELTANILIQQLPLYRGDARSAYLRFAAFDFVFPLVAGLFLSVLWALLLRLNTWQGLQRFLLWNLPLFPLVGTAWDWLENVSLLILLNTSPDSNQVWIESALFFKRLKLIWLTIDGAITGLLLTLLLLNGIYRLLQRHTNSVAVIVNTGDNSHG